MSDGRIKFDPRIHHTNMSLKDVVILKLKEIDAKLESERLKAKKLKDLQDAHNSTQLEFDF